MEITRLTERNESGGITVRDMPAALKKLAELEDAEENGQLARLPCVVGDVIYLIADDNLILDYKVIGCYIGKSGVEAIRAQRDYGLYIKFATQKIDRLGKDWFLSHKEAFLKGRTG